MIAYRVSEDERVLIPTMVDIDGFFCSHLTEPVNVPTEEEAERFVKEFKPVNAHLDTDLPYAMNNLTSPRSSRRSSALRISACAPPQV